MFETNKYIYRNGYLRGCLLLDKGRPKFLQISKGQKSATVMAHKNKTYKYLVDTTRQNVSCLLLRLNSWLEKDAILASPK